MPMMIHVYEQNGFGTENMEENCAKRNAVRIAVFQGGEYED
jgi:hypothetical protein